MEYTISELKKKTTNLEKEMSDLVRKFEKDTGLYVQNKIHMYHTTCKKPIPKVEIEIWLC